MTGSANTLLTANIVDGLSIKIHLRSVLQTATRFRHARTFPEQLPDIKRLGRFSMRITLHFALIYADTNSCMRIETEGLEDRGTQLSDLSTKTFHSAWCTSSS